MLNNLAMAYKDSKENIRQGSTDKAESSQAPDEAPTARIATTAVSNVGDETPTNDVLKRASSQGKQPVSFTDA